MIEPAQPVRADAVRWDPVRMWAAIVGGSIVAVYVAAFIVQLVIAQTTGEVVNLIGAAFVYGIVASAVGCALLAVGVGTRPRTRRYVVLASVMGVLAGLAPIALVVFFRLSIRTCVVLNTLSLPWPEPWREIAHLAAGAIWLASTILLTIALTRPRLRRAGIALWIWSGVIAIPTFFFWFLTIYGDPFAGCVPV